MPTEDAIARADPAQKKVFAHLLKAVQTLGPVIEERGVRSVLLRSRGRLLGVHPKRDGLDLQIVTDHAIRATRVTKLTECRPDDSASTVRVAGEKEVDAELLGRLRERTT